METDGNGATVRTPLFDYRKAFDLTDHSILVNKLRNLTVPSSTINWIIDFLSNRFQRIELAKGCYSEWAPVPSGAPQGTKLGPWLFVLMINDLDVRTPHLWKIVDDTTASEVVPKGNISNAQSIVDQVIEWSRVNRVQLNPDKCKELRISFARNPVELDTLIIDGKEVEVVSTAKLLGLTVSANLTWNAHIEEVVKKARKRLYFLVQLKRAKLPPTDLILFYNTCVRSVIDYVVQVFYYALLQYLINELIHIEKRAISIIMPDTSYNNACEILGESPIVDHIDSLCDKLLIALHPIKTLG